MRGKWVAGKNKRNLIIIAVAILVVAIVLSSFVYLNSQKPYAGNIESITIGTVPNETNSLIYVANDQKYFADNGLNITLKSYGSGLADAKAVLNGEINIGIATEFIVAEEAFDNASIYVLGTDSKFLSFSMVARTDEGINSISDLNGKTIGVSFGTIAQFYLGRFLELSNLNLSKVTLVNVPFAQSQNALANGTINAVLTLQPYVSQIESSLGNEVVVWPAQSNQLGYNDLVCSRSWAQQHPDLIIRFLKSLIHAEDFVINHQNQAMGIVTKALNYSSTYLPPLWSNYQFTVSLDQSQILAMQDESRWLIQNNLTSATTIPSFLNYIYFDGLETVKPTAVNILR
jgi:NitT/TauT family transport system substrate-binding protein